MEVDVSGDLVNKSADAIIKKEIGMVDEKEFYRRFDQIVPGTSASGEAPPKFESGIYFERLSMSGLEEMHRYSSDERLYEFFEFSPFDTIEKTKAYIEKLQQRMGNDPFKRNAMYWFVRRKKDGYLVGTACLVELNYARKSIEWGYGVDPEQWGAGDILQIQEILKYHVFEVLQLNRLDGITMVENLPTISSVLAAGMKHEGTLRQYYCKNGIYHDGWKYGMVSQDYFQEPRGYSNSGSKYTIEDVIELIASVLTEEEVNSESSMRNTASWDSLNHMSIMVAISEEMGISFAPGEVARATSVKAIASLITTVHLKN